MRQIDEQPLENEKGLHFVLTLLAGFGTILLLLINYFQTNSVNKIVYFGFLVLISVSILYLLGLLFYISIVGFSIEIKNLEYKKKILNFSSYLYKANFVYFLIFLIIMSILIPLLYFSEKIDIPFFHSSLLASIITIILIVILAIVLQKKFGIEKYFTYFYKYFNLSAVLFITIEILLVIIFISNTSIVIDIENIHYKNNPQIPVQIQTTGPDMKLIITLYKEEFNDLSSIAEINFSDSQYNLQTISNNSLHSNAMGSGKYCIFINTTSLNPGYYELKCERSILIEQYTVAGFYLLNISEFNSVE